MKKFNVVLKQGSVSVEAKGVLEALNIAHEKLGLSGDIELVKVSEVEATEPTLSQDDWDLVIIFSVLMTSLIMGIIYGGTFVETLVYAMIAFLVSALLGVLVVILKDNIYINNLTKGL